MRKARIIYYLLIMIVILSTISCSKNQSNYIGTTELGLYANDYQEYNEWIYFINYRDDGTLYKVRGNGEDKIKVIDESISKFRIYEEQIYYISFIGNYLYRINIDGSDKKCLTQSEFEGVAISKIDIAGDWVYAVLPPGILLRIKTDGSKFTVLEDRVRDFSIDGELIYYLRPLENNPNAQLEGTESDNTPENILLQSENYFEVWKMQIDGTQEQKIMKDISPSIDYDEDWIYYISDDNKSINKVSFDGEEIVKITDCGYAKDLKLVGDYLYYSDNGISHGLYKIKTNGMENTLITDKCIVLFIGIWDNWLVCLGLEGNEVIRISDIYNTDEVVIDILSAQRITEFYE